MFRQSLRAALCGVAALALAGCDVSPAYVPPAFAFAPAFQGRAPATPVALAQEAWWARFHDPVLDDLVSAALAASLDLAQARERVVEARALARTVPETVRIGGDLRAGRRDGRSIDAANGGDASLEFDWLFDPWGGRQAQLRAAAGRVEVAQAELDAARLLLVSNVATAYVNLRFQQRALALRRDELASRRQTLAAVTALNASGAATRLELLRAEALVTETQALIPGLEAAAQAEQARIAVLLARMPGTLKPVLGTGGARQPVADLSGDIGIPADLLRNRPDLRVAERLYYAAVAEIGAARAQLYPQLSLGGELSVSAFGALDGRSSFFGPTLRLPSLPNGPTRAAVEVRESRARQSLTEWQAGVLEALGEVEAALAAYAGSRKAVGAARRTVALYAEAIALNREVIGSGGATIRDLLDAEQSLTVANVVLSQSLRGLGQDFVALNVSLGAGHGVMAQR